MTENKRNNNIVVPGSGKCVRTIKKKEEEKNLTRIIMYKRGKKKKIPDTAAYERDESTFHGSRE